MTTSTSMQAASVSRGFNRVLYQSGDATLMRSGVTMIMPSACAG